MYSELLSGASTGVYAPQINGQPTRHGDDRFFALCAGGARAFSHNAQTLFHRRIVGLEAHHAPGTLHQSRSQPRVTAFGYAPWNPFTPAAAFAGTQSGVRTDRAPIVKPVPITNLAGEHHASQFTQPGRDRSWRGCFQFTG